MVLGSPKYPAAVLDRQGLMSYQSVRSLRWSSQGKEGLLLEEEDDDFVEMIANLGLVCSRSSRLLWLLVRGGYRQSSLLISQKFPGL